MTTHRDSRRSTQLPTSMCVAIAMVSGILISIAEEPKAPMSTTASKPAFTNHLAQETSPYLLQHKNNPVDWYPWGPEALGKARSEQKPIFLSIGYAACHWCHVMEHESFEDEQVAAILNEHFISIKVDREERPDLDDIYMTTVQMLTGSGGWPMTVFLTPDGKPFFGGTYFPKEDRWGKPGFLSLLSQIQNGWESQRDRILQSSSEITVALRRSQETQAQDTGMPLPSVLTAAAKSLDGAYDKDDGGWGNAPKFPPSPTLLFLLRHHRLTGDQSALDMATFTLDRMAWGGMYDQIGGGFHRYSVDAEWLVPHFEKMLYDNAQLCSVYTEAYRATRNPFYKRIATDILGYVARELTDENGGFYSSEDADSEGEEGKFYVWDHSELHSLLSPQDAEFFNAVYAIKAKGNFSSHEHYHRGKNIPHLTKAPAEFAAQFELTEPVFWERLDGLRAQLLQERDKRVHPGLDDKILSAWNGLMISAAADAGVAFDAPEYTAMAQKAANFVLTEMREDGNLLRTHRNGNSHIPAYLDDYIFMIGGLLDLYEADFDIRWLGEAEALADRLVRDYWDETHGGFYFALGGQEDLIIRMKPNYDGAIPSGNSMAALVLPRLGMLIGREDLQQRGYTILKQANSGLAANPRAAMVQILAAQAFLQPGPEIAIVGANSAETNALLAAARLDYIPNALFARLDPAADSSAAAQKQIPLLKDKSAIGGKSTAFVCRNFACQRPVHTASELADQLKALTNQRSPK